jgi:excisionase family DNA binding protein
MTPAAELLKSFPGDRDDAEGASDRRFQEKHGLPTDRAALSVKEFCAWAGVSRSTLYNMIAAHEVRVRKVGNRTVVLCRDALAWLEALPELHVEDVSPAPSPTTAPDEIQAPSPRYISAQEVARRFDCSLRTVRRWIAEGLLPAVTVGGLCRIAETDLEVMIQKQA